MVLLPRILHDDTVTIVTTTTGGPDDDGVPTVVTTETVWPGVNVQQARTEDLHDYQRETSTVYYRVSGDPVPVPVDSGDMIKWRGKTYLIDGEPDTRTGAHRIEHTSLLMYRSRG